MKYFLSLIIICVGLFFLYYQTGSIQLPSPFEKTPISETINTTGIIADFSLIEYYPNLKSKVGLASNIKASNLQQAKQYINEIGPGMVCSNIEFDLWYKHPEEENPALEELRQSDGRPLELMPTPTSWFRQYGKMLGDMNVSQLYQLTGAPAQFQVPSAVKPAIHPSPTDVAGAAKLISQWTSKSNHAYPVLWSVWNEPGHTFMGIDRKKNIAGQIIFEKESKAEFETRESAQRTLSAKKFIELYAQYKQEMEVTNDAYSKLGLASFLTADFNPVKLSTAGNVYFDEAMQQISKDLPLLQPDFITLNNFNGGWATSLGGVRNVLGVQSNQGPVIYTQIAPRSLKFTEDGEPTKEVGKSVSPTKVAVDTLKDVAQIQRATDVQSACYSYWIGGEYGFLSESLLGTLVPNVRYEALKLFSQLPVTRAKLDFNNTGLNNSGINGLAGVSHAAAAVLLWNETDTDVSVPLSLSHIPSHLLSNANNLRMRVLTDDQSVPVESVFVNGSTIIVPGNGIVLVRVDSEEFADPLLRRQSLSRVSDIATRFLSTMVMIDKIAVPCTNATKLPGVETCSKNTGTYGVYDSVRSVAYLGKGIGTVDPIVKVAYESLPKEVYVNAMVYNAAKADNTVVKVSAFFPQCNLLVKTSAPLSNSGDGGLLRFATVPDSCRVGMPGEITVVLENSTLGTQAEVYLSSRAEESETIAEQTFNLILQKNVVDVEENLPADDFWNE